MWSRREVAGTVDVVVGVGVKVGEISEVAIVVEVAEAVEMATEGEETGDFAAEEAVEMAMPSTPRIPTLSQALAGRKPCQSYTSTNMSAGSPLFDKRSPCGRYLRELY